MLQLNLTHKDELLPLVRIRAKSLERKKHPYELLKASGYIKQFLEEFNNWFFYDTFHNKW